MKTGQFTGKSEWWWFLSCLWYWTVENHAVLSPPVQTNVNQPSDQYSEEKGHGFENRYRW